MNTFHIPNPRSAIEVRQAFQRLLVEVVELKQLTEAQAAQITALQAYRAANPSLLRLAQGGNLQLAANEAYYLALTE
jgi:hypothetical protein